VRPTGGFECAGDRPWPVEPDAQRYASRIVDPWDMFGFGVAADGCVESDRGRCSDVPTIRLLAKRFDEHARCDLLLEDGKTPVGPRRGPGLIADWASVPLVMSSVRAEKRNCRAGWPQIRDMLKIADTECTLADAVDGDL